MPPLNTLPQSSQDLIRQMAGKVPALVGPEFIMRWSSRSTKDLNTEFRNRFESDLTEQTRLNIIAYLLQASGAVSGDVPLTMDTEVKLGTLIASKVRR